MTYTLEILAAADAENVETITWLTEHASHEHAAVYATALSSLDTKSCWRDRDH